MSTFIASNGTITVARPIDFGLCKNTDILQEPSYSLSEPYTIDGRKQDVDILWTRSTFPVMFSSGAGVPENYMSQRWEWCWPPTGGHYPKAVNGTVVDVNGNTVSGASVKLFNTATGLLVDTATSDVDGSYRTGDPNAVNCFAVGDLQGTPETMGTTIQELTGV